MHAYILLFYMRTEVECKVENLVLVCLELYCLLGIGVVARLVDLIHMLKALNNLFR